MVDLATILSYDKYIVTFSAGKDSTATLLHLLDIGVPKEKIELWHHDIDGRGDIFMDWECTPAYCRAFAKAFGIPIYFSWKEGGFKREMLRNNSRTAPTSFEDENHMVVTTGGKLGKESTRMKYPQVSADLSVRWCSGSLKIDVYSTAITNQVRFRGIKTLVISGERGEESTARAKYNDFEPDRADLRDGIKYQRHIDRWRPVLRWTEQQVWAIIEKYRIRAHIAYYIGFSRVSCKFCIFGNADQFLSAFIISPKIGEEIASYEDLFNTTIKRKEGLKSLIKRGTAYPGLSDTVLISAATSVDEYPFSIILDDSEPWVLPIGAYGKSCGPS